MLLKIVYLLTCRVLRLAVLVFRGDLAKDAELLVLRHENAVLLRHAGRVRYEPTDRGWFAALDQGIRAKDLDHLAHSRPLRREIGGVPATRSRLTSNRGATISQKRPSRGDPERV